MSALEEHFRDSIAGTRPRLGARAQRLMADWCDWANVEGRKARCAQDLMLAFVVIENDLDNEQRALSLNW